MFVFEALLLTFMTTPAVLLLYPPEVRKRVSGTGPDYLATGDGAGAGGDEKGDQKRLSSDSDDTRKTRFTVVLDKLEHLPGMMTITQLISSLPSNDVQSATAGQSLSLTATSSTFGACKSESYPVTIDALRLIELSDRTSAVMKSSVADQLIRTDPVLAVFKTFGDLNNLSVSSSLSIVTYNDLAGRVADHARENMSQLVLVPWLPPTISFVHSPDAPVTPSASATPFMNPFDALFRNQSVDKPASVVHSHFIRGVFSHCHTDVALFVDRTDRVGVHAPESSTRFRSGHNHILVPFFGGPDDRLALEFAVQLCENPKTTATVIRLTKSEGSFFEGDSPERLEAAHSVGEDEQQIADHLRANGITTTSVCGLVACRTYRITDLIDS